MIKFNAELTVKKIESKSVRKRDGGTFDFTEVTLEQKGKRPTIIVARANDDVVPTLREGLKANFDLAITSFTSQDGRTFNNFLITFADVKQPVQPLETALREPDVGDELPF